MNTDFNVPPMPEAPPEDPTPLIREVTIPAFPTNSLPTPIAKMVAELAEATQTDEAMGGTSALSVMAASTTGHAVIEVRPGWREPLNLYTVTVANPGERKSAVQCALCAPLLDVEQELSTAGTAIRNEATLQKQIATMAADKAKQSAAKAAGTDQWASTMSDAQSAQAMADSITIPEIPRIVADDVTPEAVGTLLAEQNGSLSIVSAEGGLFDIIAGRYTGALNMDVWLKGHAGDPLKVDRKGRPPEYIRQPALTVALMVQPTVLDLIAAHQQFRGRGLLARFMYAFPVSKVGHRKIGPKPVSEDVREAYAQTLTTLTTDLAKWTGDDRIVLTMTPSAHEAIKKIEEALEPTLAADGDMDPLVDWGSKYVGAIARIAGILHLYDKGVDKGTRTPVSAETILAANRIGEYFRACAIKAFSTMGTDRTTADAVYLLRRIKSLGADEVSERDMQRAAKRFKTLEEMLPAVDRLVDHGWIVPLPDSGPTGGRPASRKYRVTEGQKGQNTPPDPASEGAE